MRNQLILGAAVATTMASATAGPAAEKANEQVVAFMGSFSHGVPIEVPPFHGIEPRLGFGYTSEGRNGLMGVGWGFGGFGEVRRVSVGRGTPLFDATDVFLLNGQELIPCSVPAGSASCLAGGTHSTKVESYTKVVRDPVANKWTVWTKDGTRTVYEPIVTHTQGTVRWGQRFVIDTRNNTVEYQWTQNGDWYPWRVSYNGYVVTVYLETRPDPLHAPNVTGMVATNHRIRSVIVADGANAIRGYKLSYTTSAATGRSLLASVQMFGTDLVHTAGLITGGTSLPAATFTYQNDAAAHSFVGQSPGGPAQSTEPVIWTKHVRTYSHGSSGNSLYKESGGFEWNAGASSAQGIASGNGYVEFRTNGGGKMIGLSHGDSDETNYDIDFAFYELGANQVYVSENGVLQGPWPVNDDDILRVEVVNNVVSYKRNGSVLYVSANAPVFPLVADSSIRPNFAIIHDVVISGALQDEGSWCPATSLVTGDFNGDGRTDQMCYQTWGGGTTRVKLATATGFGPVQTWSTNQLYGTIIPGDFDNDGKTDLANYSGGDGDFFVSRSTGTGFTPPVLWGNANAVDPNGHHACKINPAVTSTGDFNGDGLTDVSCKVLGLPQIFVGLSTGTSFNFSIFGDLSCDVYERTGTGDFNKDGKDDWYCIGGGNFYILPSTGTTFTYATIPPLTGDFCPDMAYYTFGDFNGDGSTDAFCTYTGKMAFFTGTSFQVMGTYGSFCYDATAVFAADVDGDGASELVCNNHYAGPSDIQVRKWQAGTLGAAQTWKASWCEGPAIPGDYNGDSKTDLLCPALGASVAVAGTGGVMSDLMVASGNGIGGQVQVAYTPSSNYSNQNGASPRYMITSVTRLDGRGGSSTSNYFYAGALTNRQERQFMGFEFVQETMPCLTGETTCPVAKTWLRQDSIAAVGSPERVERWKNTIAAADVRTFEYTVGASPQGIHFALLTRDWSYTFDDSISSGPSKVTTATRAYDAYGNVSEVVTYGEHPTSGDERTEVLSYRPNTAAFIVGALARHETYAGIGTSGQKLGDTRIAYDASGTWDAFPTQGLATRVEQWLDAEDRYVALHATYSSSGNMLSETDETSRTTTWAYDGIKGTFPATMTNGVGEVVEDLVWDMRCGVPTQSRDQSLQVTTMEYDALCRLTRTDHPSGHWEARQYLQLGTPTSQRVSVTTPAPDGDNQNHFVRSYFDGFGRTYEIASRGSSLQQIRVSREYNARGLLDRESAPRHGAATPQWTLYTYDGLNRPTRVEHPDGNAVETEYGLWSVTTYDEHGHATTEVTGGRGQRLASTKTADSQSVTTVYAHDLMGRLVGITDARGNVWSWIFDSLSRTLERDDPDAGIWSFTYDDAGRVLSQTDAKLQATTFQYDLAGRPTHKVNPTDTVVTTRSEARPGYFNAGRITSIENNVSRLEMDYDVAGRVVRQTRTLDSQQYVMEHRYDMSGRLRGITFPDGDAVGTPASPWTYDRANRLTGIPGIATFTYDAAGRPLTQNNVNGTVTTRTYSAQRGFLTGITTTGPGATTIQNLAYAPDESGMLESVNSHIPDETASYEYDGFHRLRFERDAGQVVRNEYQYDNIGRMTYNQQLGPYLYAANGQPRPHAPTKIGAGIGAGLWLNYDANGNLLTGRSRTYTWNADNRPTQIDGWSFVYGGSGERLKKTSGTSITRYPFGDDYEIADGVISKYLTVSGMGVIAKRVGLGATSATFWLHGDRLGSITAVTEGSGAEVLRRRYQPYGDQAAAAGSHTESRGYIGQRGDETALSYLHARYYDSAAGIFVSPDPLGPRGGLLAFGYGSGDPINSSDPSGLCHDGYWTIRYDMYGKPYDSYWCPTGDVHAPSSSGWLRPGGRTYGEDLAEEAYRRIQDRIAEGRARRHARGELTTDVPIDVPGPVNPGDPGTPGGDDPGGTGGTGQPISPLPVNILPDTEIQPQGHYGWIQPPLYASHENATQAWFERGAEGSLYLFGPRAAGTAGARLFAYLFALERYLGTISNARPEAEYWDVTYVPRRPNCQLCH